METSSAALDLASLQRVQAHILRADYTTAFECLEDVETFLLHCYPTLQANLVKVSDDVGDSKWVIVCCTKYSRVEGRPVKPVRLLFGGDGMYCFEVLLKKVKSGSWKESLPPHREICDHLGTFLESSGYLLCPGIVNFDTEFGETVRFKPKSLRVWSQPISRYDSDECSLWLRPNNQRLPVQSSLINTCCSCRLLYRSLVTIKKRALEASPGHKERWTEPSSNRPLKYISPASQVKRLTKGSEQRRYVQRTLLQAENTHDIQLAADQDNQLQCLIKEIEENGQSQLEGVFREADEAHEGLGAELHQVWDRDVTSRKQFFEDQLKNKSSSRGNRWSTITFRIALAIYTRSPTAYEALRGFGILQLPGVSSLKTFTSFNVETPGFNEERLAYARRQYNAMVREKEELGEPAPFSEGILIFDEVKVGLKVHYHAKTQKLIGLAMSPDELASLHDVFQTLQPDHRTKKTSYILQYLWRCTASDFDIIGPYYTSAESVNAKFILATLFETMHKFQIYCFETKMIVCDGASSNLAAIKILTGFGCGAYGNQPLNSSPDIHWIQPWFLNPFTNKKVFILICPSHQLKNMVSALYSSRDGRTKNFSLEGVTFGWSTIVDMFTREVQRARASVPRRIPGLRESYVYRDIWTRLNVRPAKIMQQQYVLAELHEYLDSYPADAASTRLTVQYLEALNLIFEEGVLSHEQINSISSPVLEHMEQGYKFFTTWLESLLAEGLIATNPYQKSFLSWQTWDLMRLMWYGFIEYCKEFLTLHPGYYIAPLRANGSAIETIFSQLKHSSRGTLTAVSYGPARAQILTKRNVHGQHVREEYRDAPLYIKTSELPSRKRSKCD